MRILVDMDDVLANFELALYATLKKDYPSIKLWNKARREHLFFDKEIGCGHREIDNIIERRGFFFNLPVVLDAIDGIRALDKKNDVFICTRPLTQYKNCVLEKYDWVHKHLGKAWTKRIILTKNKAIVDADYLIDDNPLQHKTEKHHWELLLFETGYSRYHNLQAYTWKTLKEYFK
jgi:5'-nucleotidase